MATRDVRKESPEVIYELRVRAVEMKLQGLTHGTVATTLDVSVAASRRWWRMYCEEGKSGLVLGQRGRPIGVCRTLSPSQEKIVALGEFRWIFLQSLGSQSCSWR